MRSESRRLWRGACALVVALACSCTSDEEPAAYRACDAAAPCPDDAECVYGLCLDRCNGGPACVGGEVCWDDGCRLDCDEAHPCTDAYSCVDGECADDPCGHPEFWPLSLVSTSPPVVVHYRDPIERDVAQQVLELVGTSWDVEVEGIGFTAPIPDGGACGPDSSFDVFVWRSYEGGAADVIAEDPSTAWDDYLTYFIIDPWGPYGGELLDATVAHELNHAMQAADDWWESPIFFEMTAQFIEDVVFDDNDEYRDVLFDYQSNPDWSFDRDDQYETWYMYGSALYLFFLRDGPFEGDASFVSELWRRCRNEPGENEPDFEDALDGVLGERFGSSFIESVKTFSRWRYFTASRDDGLHFEEGAEFPEDTLVKIERTARITDAEVAIEPGPMMLGAVYVEIAREEGDPARATIGLDGDPGAAWSVQAVPGLEPGVDGEELDLSSGEATLDLGALDARTLVVLALPLDAGDPDERTDERFPFTLTLTAAE